MNFGLIFANAGPFTEPDALTHLARASEAAGIESLWSVEHVVIPVGYKTEYPYDKSGKIPGGEKMPVPDPIIPLAFAAAVTEKIKLGTGILILPQRHPFYVAKEMATLDRLSKGRAILGIGVGWLVEEFEALGIDFQTRASRTKESVAAIRSLWKGEPEAFDGEFFRWGPMESNPKPAQAGGIPIVVGGHSDIAAKRAARYGNGFFPGKGNEEELTRLLGVMRGECARIGRDASEIEITLPMPGHDLDKIKRYADLGATRLATAPPGFDADSLDAGLAAFRDTVLDKL
jgi:probable F420-dependent oxidoreductase